MRSVCPSETIVLYQRYLRKITFMNNKKKKLYSFLLAKACPVGNQALRTAFLQNALTERNPEKAKIQRPKG